MWICIVCPLVDKTTFSQTLFQLFATYLVTLGRGAYSWYHSRVNITQEGGRGVNNQKGSTKWATSNSHISPLVAGQRHPDWFWPMQAKSSRMRGLILVKYFFDKMNKLLNFNVDRWVWPPEAHTALWPGAYARVRWGDHLPVHHHHQVPRQRVRARRQG